MPTKLQPGFTMWAVPRFHRQPISAPPLEAGTVDADKKSPRLRFFGELTQIHGDSDETAKSDVLCNQREPVLQH